jgi:hypothetical protein
VPGNGHSNSSRGGLRRATGRRRAIGQRHGQGWRDSTGLRLIK